MPIVGAPTIEHPFDSERDHIDHHRDLETVVNGLSVGAGGPATGVTFTPAAGIAAVNVQAAIEELVADQATILAAHVAATGAHAANKIAFTPTGTVAATDVQAAIAEVAAEAGSGGGSAATTTFAPAGTIAATNVQAAVEEVATDAAAALSAHAHNATAVIFTPAGSIAATTVAGAIAELDAEKAALAHTHTVAEITSFAAEVYKAAQTIDSERTTDFTLALSDAGKRIPLNSASARTITIPLNATVPIPIGTFITLRDIGTARWTISPTGGVTLNPQPNVVGNPVTLGAGSTVILQKVGTDAWDYVGSVKTRDPRGVSWQVGSAATALATTDRAYFIIPSSLNGYDLISVTATTPVQSTSGDVTGNIVRTRGAVNVLSTAFTVNANEADSTTGTPAVVNGSNDDVVTGDLYTFVPSAAGTGCKGLVLRLEFA